MSRSLAKIPRSRVAVGKGDVSKVRMCLMSRYTYALNERFILVGQRVHRRRVRSNMCHLFDFATQDPIPTRLGKARLVSTAVAF